MEEKAKARLEDLLLGASIGLSVILVFVVPLVVLDYNQCTAPAEEKELRMLLFHITVAVAVIAALVLGVRWADYGSRKMKYSCILVLVGLAMLLVWFVSNFVGIVCHTR